MSTRLVRHVIALAIAALAAASLHAGSSGQTALLTMQGSGASSDFGDYVSETGSLNTFYRFFVEVPPGVGRLVVEIFDADIGIGQPTEDTANPGRDRDRGGYDSAIQYRMVNPSGAARNTRFTTGDAALPAGSDNAWLALFDSTGDRVADTFSTVAYTNQNGTMNWAGDWTETNDDNNANAGEIRVTGGELRVGDNGGAASTIHREANLAGFTTATFAFDFHTSNSVDAADRMLVQVSANGGASWTTLETFTGPTAPITARSYNITTSIAANTRIRFIEDNGYGNNEYFFVDNVEIRDSAIITPGHWEVRLDMSGAVTGGDDINAFGIRAHDGTAGAGGTELNVYVDSIVPVGVNPPGSGSLSRNYVFHPFVTSGCTCSQNDFDYDLSASASYSSPSAAFTQNYTGAALSNTDVWSRATFSGWTTDASATDYGVWTLNHTLSSYLVGGTPNGNYGSYYTGRFNAAANPPPANPLTGAFRVYLPSDAGAAPVKPYLEQILTHDTGKNPPQVGQVSTFTVTVRLTNPTARPIVFSAANPVVANVPGAGAVYGGFVTLSQGSVVSQPAVGGTGNVVWNPGTVAAGNTALLAYNVSVVPSSAGQRIAVTGTPASNGTRAQYLDETANSTQARATYLAGPLCELAVTEALVTDVLLSSFEVTRRGVEWTTASEAGTIGFNVYREDGSQVNEVLVPSSRNGRYRIDDPQVHDGAAYVIEEWTASGRINRHGPLTHLERATPENRTPRKLPAVKAKNGRKPVAVMVGVAREGVVRIPAPDLAAALNAPTSRVQAALGSGKIAVTDRGTRVAWSSDGEALLFFAQKPDSIYSNERVYRVELTRGVEMPRVNVAPAAGPLSTFRESLDVEQDAFGASVLPVDPESDYWFWDFVLGGVPGYDRPSFTVDVPAVASADSVSLEVRLQGAFAGAAHRARVSLNGVPVGETTWDSFDSHAATFGVPNGVLRDGVNTLVVEGLAAAGTGFDVFYVDGFTLGYERFARPADGHVEVRRGGVVTAGPFATAPLILDISNRAMPSVLAGASFDGSNVSLAAPPDTQSIFFTDSFVAPAFLRGSDALSLDRNLRADWVVIAPRAFREPAEALARLRESEGLAALVVDLEAVYDEFAGGNNTPHAIRAFIASTKSWQVSPRYVVLAGTGSLDYRGIEGPAGPVPPLMTSTADGLFAADSLFADGNGDFVPDIAIGRIPVATAHELDDYVRKLERAAGIDTRAPLVFSSDRRDRGADFRGASAEAARPHAARPLSRIDVDDLGPSAARKALLDTWRDGASLVSWTGHGGLDQLASSAILTAADAASLTSSGMLPVVVAMTCTINRFENGFVEPLGAALTRTGDAGALAVWSASALSAHGEARELQNEFMRLAAQQPDARVGDLVVAALAARPSPTSRVYLLLGDPAVRLGLPDVQSHDGRPAARTGE